MDEHPCHQHRPGQHTDACLTGDCGFCGTSLNDVASGECRACLRIVCEHCDGRYQADLGPICQPCTPSAPANSATGELVEYRLCVFEFDLSCGHTAFVALTGWYPVTVSCCDRLGGTIARGDYHPVDSDVDYVRGVYERYERRPQGTPPGATQVIGRRPRTDEPRPPNFPGLKCSAGRYPARVGATFSWDGSIAKPETT